jgi:hypothetical protein
MKLELSKHDEDLVQLVRVLIRSAVVKAERPAAAAKRIAAEAIKHRNKGRAAAIRSHPFTGVCEVTGRPLDTKDKVLDELEPEKGYEGRVRWVCPRCNNSGRRSCGDSKENGE